MAGSQTEICNIALNMLGADRITAITDESANARRLNDIYEEVLFDVLREHPWNFAIQRAQLARLGSNPLFEYDCQFQLPNDCLRVISASDSSGYAITDNDYKIEGRALLCDETTIYIKYIAKITDPTQYDTQFIYLFATRLAAETAYAITNNKATADLLMQLYTARLEKAKASDAQESSSIETQDLDLWTIEDRS